MSCLITILFLGGNLPLFGVVHAVEIYQEALILETPNCNFLKTTIIDCNNFINYYLFIISSWVYVLFTVGILEIIPRFLLIEALSTSDVCMLFFKTSLSNFFFQAHFGWFLIKFFSMLWLFIAVRAVVPRYRYDQLMALSWKNFLPLALFFFIFYAIIFLYYYYYIFGIYLFDFNLFSNSYEIISLK
jgi:NADH:ubiquinone oxidoreductase subunit H